MMLRLGLVRASPRCPAAAPCLSRSILLHASAARGRSWRGPLATSGPSRLASPSRWASTSPGTPAGMGAAAGPRKSLYPERLLIYHAGTGRTTFLACLKLTTIFTFAFFGLVATPAYLTSEEPAWKAAGIFLCGLIPLVSVAYITGPFVSSIHIRLPPFARQSRDVLARWARDAAFRPTPPSSRTASSSSSSSSSSPGSTATAPPVLEITTMTLIGKPRVSVVRTSDLTPCAPSSSWRQSRLGLVNFVRRPADVAAENAARPWWRFRAVSAFHVTPGGETRAPSGWLWTEVAQAIERRASTAQARG